MEITWSDTAKGQLREIYIYYKEATGVRVARSISDKLIKKIHLLVTHPTMGQRENNPSVADRNFRYLIEGNHKIIYKTYLDQNLILIAAVFDTRRNPKGLKV